MGTAKHPSTLADLGITTGTTEGVDALTSRLKDVGEKAGERIVELKDSAKQTLGRRVDSLGDAMKAHPIAFAAGAFAVGYLYARIRHW